MAHLQGSHSQQPLIFLGGNLASDNGIFVQQNLCKLQSAITTEKWPNHLGCPLPLNPHIVIEVSACLCRVDVVVAEFHKLREGPKCGLGLRHRRHSEVLTPSCQFVAVGNIKLHRSRAHNLEKVNHRSAEDTETRRMDETEHQ